MFAPEISYRALADFMPLGQSLEMQVLMNGWLGVDVFFILSGLLTVYVGLPQFEKGRISWVTFTLLRFFRFAPSIGGVILLNVLWPLFASGPVLKRYMKETVNNCYTHWWATLFNFSNWLHPNDMVSSSLRHSYIPILIILLCSA